MSAPVLYHIQISHYNEKVRWALDYKRVPHVRRAPPPMMHTVWALVMTRGVTFPVLAIDGVEEMFRRHRGTSAEIAA